MLNKLFFTLIISTLSLYGSWSEYKNLFIAEDGRVIDKVNNNITHSESIGYAMYLSIKNNDLETFKKIHSWYKNNLTKNKFGLISWKWGQSEDASWKTLDFNNASDGDLWIAYDNLLMYEKTQEARYKDDALLLMKNIKKHLIINHRDSLYLLPGKIGFNTEKDFQINLSYYLFFIFDKFTQYDDDSVWINLKKDGLLLMENSRFSSLNLHADWININKNTLEITTWKNNSFAYDALRVPLNILLSDIKNKDQLLQPYKNYVNAMKTTQNVYGVVNLKDGSIQLNNYSYAHLSVYNMIDKHFNGHSSFSQKINTLKGKRKNDYYSYSIHLLSTSN